MGDLFLIFRGTSILVSIVDAPFCIPTHSVQGCHSSTSSPTFVAFRGFFDNSHPDSDISLLFWFVFPWWLLKHCIVIMILCSLSYIIRGYSCILFIIIKLEFIHREIKLIYLYHEKSFLGNAKKKKIPLLELSVSEAASGGWLTWAAAY